MENQPVALDGVTELLVHGVGGESAEVTLHEPHPMLVAGDATAGFYRGPDVDGRHRESYSHLLRPPLALFALVRAGAASAVRGAGGSDAHRLLTTRRQEPKTRRATVAAADSCMAGMAWL
jgi:hypothetical protein